MKNIGAFSIAPPLLQGRESGNSRHGFDGRREAAGGVAKRREAEAGTDFPRQNRSVPLHSWRCIHDVVGNLRQLLNSRSQVSRSLLDLWWFRRIAGEIASLGDDILARICDTVNELQQLLGCCLIHLKRCSAATTSSMKAMFPNCLRACSIRCDKI